MVNQVWTRSWLTHGKRVGRFLEFGQTREPDVLPTLILMAEASLRTPLRDSFGTDSQDPTVRAVIERLNAFDATIEPQLPQTLEDAVIGDEPSHFKRDPRDFFVVRAQPSALAPLAQELRNARGVAAAYVKAGVELAASSRRTGPAVQGYVANAPDGVGAQHAWALPGGDGTGVAVFDVELGWNEHHEALRGARIEPDIAGALDRRSRDHGTAVLGILAGRGAMSGLCPSASVICVAVDPQDPGQALYSLFPRTRAGDVVLIEVQRRPQFAGYVVSPALMRKGDQAQAYLPLEWWPDEWNAIAGLTSKGRIVVEVAGNGNMALEDKVLDREPDGLDVWAQFGHGWRNPLGRPVGWDSHAILVGAGVPPSPYSTSGHPDLARHYPSNHGDAVDVQGWGEGVATAGSAAASMAQPENSAYTADFGDTSAAAAIVAGVIACTQGMLRAADLTPLTSLQMRDLLRASGTPQADAPFCGLPVQHRVGPRPDLGKLIRLAYELAQR